MTLIEHASTALDQLFARAGVDDSHGTAHALAVLCHVDTAIAKSNLFVGAPWSTAIRLAALLHDADDRKYFRNGSNNAERIVRDLRVSDTVLRLVLRMIELVSFSANGNGVPADAVENPMLLWPRWADRIEALGEIGIQRCYVHNGSNPLDLPGITPTPETALAVFAHATPERLTSYRTTGGSHSMMDHFYDKLLHLGNVDPQIIQNPYLTQALSYGLQPIVKTCLVYSYGGTDALKIHIRSIIDGETQPTESPSSLA